MRPFPLLATLAALAFTLAAGPARAEPGLQCRAAIQAAERAAGIPNQLLMAIGRVESGRRDPETGNFHPLPWTINAEGRGHFFPTKAAAIAAVQQLQAQGVRSIDIGCMQVNLRHHPDAFASLEAAFDPATNARYAARFLTELNATRNDWNAAAAAYHSQTPEFANAYRARLTAALAEERARPHPPVALAAAPASRPFMPPRLGGGAAMLSNGAENLPPPTLASGPGRGLEAYRSAPVPIAGRPPLVRALGGPPALRTLALR